MYRTAYRLTIMIIFLTLAASLGGLFMKDLYRDNIFVSSAWRGSDFVTLVVALPLLIVSLILSMRGSQRAQLVWLGMVYYMLYTYAFYLFGAAFNVLFIIYVAIFTLSIFTLIFGLISLDVEAIGWKFQNGVPVKWISIYMMVLALGLFGFYAKQIIDFVLNGILPSIVIMTGHPTSLIYALDLSILVPSLVIGAIWLWKRHDWGFILAGMLISHGAVYPLGLAAGSYLASKAGIPGFSSQIAFWVALSVASIIACVFLLWNMSAKDAKEATTSNNNIAQSASVSRDAY